MRQLMSAQNSEERNYFYAACPRCTAKWYSRQRTVSCPRCGSPAVAVPAAPPPWLTRERFELSLWELERMDTVKRI